MAIGFLGTGPKMPGFGGGFDAAQLTALALKASMQRQAPAAGLAARADRGPAVVIEIDPRAAERSAEIARLSEEAGNTAAPDDWGGRPMAEPDWNKKMIAEMTYHAKQTVWANSEMLRIFDETGEIVDLGLNGERFVDPNNWEIYGGPEQFIRQVRDRLEISKETLKDLESRAPSSA